MVNGIISLCKKHGIQITMPLKFIPHGTKSLRDSQAIRRPDVVGIVPNAILDNGQASWKDMHIVVEIKQSDEDDGRANTSLEIASYAREVFGAQPNRRFIFGLTLCGMTMRLWLFDRAGVISSLPFNIKDGPDMLVHTIVGFCTMNNATLGYDPTICKSKNTLYINVQMKGVPTRFYIHDTMFIRSVVCGCRTVCMKADCEDNKNGPGLFYMVKDSWHDSEGIQKGVMLQYAT
jgi:hypothetical protein